MTLTIEINDESYQRLMEGKRLLRGSISMLDDLKGFFRPDRPPRPNRCFRYTNLAHGRVSINEKDVRFNVRFPLDETGVNPSASLNLESGKAQKFLDQYLILE